ncbi:MAG: CoA-binding protein [Lentisphaeria bacterium]|nr:CoA-binding protein [Lentisphaeria bacterium]NQZ67910.1 CoA-binding protein [Lentisphaeria bacterium]
MSKTDTLVLVLGASPKEERYSNKAVKMLVSDGYGVIPVHPAAKEILGIDCVANLETIDETIDTLTLYLGERISTDLIPQILKVNPRRIIINPGAENPALESAAKEAGIEVIEACTLVLLRTGQF